MSHHPTLRHVCVLAASALSLGLLVAAPARAADVDAASSNSDWLASKLVDGRYTNPLGGGDDEGLMIDALYAMHASGDADLAAPIVDVLDNQGGALNYISYAEFGAGWAVDDGVRDRIGGATAKTLLAAQVAGVDTHDVDGLDLVAETKGVVAQAADFVPGGRFASDGEFSFAGINPAEVGRIVDYGPNTTYNNANTFGQILGVIALARAGELTQPIVDQLLWQQCPEGYFRIFYSYNSQTNQPENCAAARSTPNWQDPSRMDNFSPPDGDTTGFGLSALLAARAAGFTGLDDDIQRAVAWLTDHQAAGGGWGGGVSTEAPNTNSTGLIVQALAEAGSAQEAVARGQAYLTSAQVTEADAATDLAGEIGAIAYKPEDYEAAKTNGGIGGLDTWIRASAQASLGVSQVGFWELSAGPDAVFTVAAPQQQVAAGATVTVAVTGLTDAEPYVVTIAGTNVAAGRAPRSGVLDLQVTVPTATPTGAAPLLVAGGQPGRRGATTVDVLGAPTTPPSTSPTTSPTTPSVVTASNQPTATTPTATAVRSVVRSGGRAVLRLTGLAPGEKITVQVRGRKVTRTVRPDGTLQLKIRVRGVVGKARIKVNGTESGRLQPIKVRVRPGPRRG
jgi:hypothetical protein